MKRPQIYKSGLTGLQICGIFGVSQGKGAGSGVVRRLSFLWVRNNIHGPLLYGAAKQGRTAATAQGDDLCAVVFLLDKGGEIANINLYKKIKKLKII